ncbi:MAG TPA: PrpF domain-containing protein [Kofleriaceae bacterium]|nr:PrpF domain-containing protein [Kofleriaceae bacterium]
MATIRAIPCTLVRGGSSKGVFLERSRLPAPGHARDRDILALFGSPDRRQIDGLGGADKLTSKVAVVGPPTRDDCDMDYEFGQVGTSEPRIDWTSNCGNISAGAAVYAVHAGYVQVPDGSASVRIHQVNTGRCLRATVPTLDGRPAVDGEFAIGGVPGTGARIDLDFGDFAASALRRGVLPTGHAVDRFDIPGWGSLELSLLDFANLCVFVRAADLQIDPATSLDALQADPELVARLEAIRAAVAVAMGIAPPDRVADELKVRVNPLLFLIDRPASYTTYGGAPIGPGEIDVLARSFARGSFSKAYPGTGAAGTGIACTVAGTIVEQLARGGAPAATTPRTVAIGHPGGILAIEVTAETPRGPRAVLGRTARVLMEGTAFLR